MTSPPSLTQISDRHSLSPQAAGVLRWPESTAANLLIAGVFGFSYVLLVVGMAPLDPTNLSWIGGDPAQHYIAWGLFRQDPHLHWPLTFTERVGYPLGDSVAFMDPIPIWLMLAKVLSPILPTPFQYLGIAAGVAVSLQFFFAALLFRQLLGRRLPGVLLPSLFFLIAPPMTWRLAGHYALVNHWLLIAALCLFVALQKVNGEKAHKYILLCGLLSGVAVAIHPYLALMVVVVLSAGVVSAYWRHLVGLKTASAIFGAIAIACLISAFALGLIRSEGGYSSGVGYGDYSLNLLALIDPGAFGGIFLRLMPPDSYTTYEGYNYLGAGVLMLAMVMLAMVMVPSVPRLRLRRLTVAAVAPLAVGCLVLTALAVSTKVSAGTFLLVDLDPGETLTKYLSVFRGSARLFWAPYYVILTGIFMAAFTLWRPRKAVVLLTLALLVQVADTSPLRRVVWEHVSRSWPQPLRSPQWSSLGREHVNLLVFPPWQCSADTPGGPDGFRMFGLLAVSQHMRTNSYYAARYSDASLAFHCDQALRDVMRKPLSPDSAYVVSAAVAAKIASGPTGPDACYTIDGFILCSTKTDFGLRSEAPVDVPVTEVPTMYASGRIESWHDAAQRGFLIGNWHHAEPGGVWSKGEGLLQFQLSPEQRAQYHSVMLQLAVPVGPHGVQYRIRSGRHVNFGTFHGSSAPRVEGFEARVPLQKSSEGIERIALTTHNAIRPVDIGLNDDSRTIGLGLMGMVLIP